MALYQESNIASWNNPNGTVGPVIGVIDEVAVFNVALEEDDVSDIMNDGLEIALGITAVSSPGKLAVTWGKTKS